MKLSIIPSQEYPSHELEIADWLAKNKEIYNRQNQQITIINESSERIEPDGKLNKGAYQIKFEKGVQEEVWIPKAFSKIIKRMEAKLSSF
jgi:hypothetical protein